LIACPNQSKQHCVKGERLLAAARQNISNLYTESFTRDTFLLVDQNLQLLMDGLGIRLKQQ